MTTLLSIIGAITLSGGLGIVNEPPVDEPEVKLG